MVDTGSFSKRIGSSQTGQLDGLLTAKGNETKVLTATGLDITATAATASSFVVPNNRNFKLTQASVRPTTATVNATTTTGVIKVSYAPVGTSTLQDITDLTINTVTGSLTTGTTTTTDFIMGTPQNLPGGTRVVLRHVQAAGGSAAGVYDVSVYAVESDNVVN